MLNKNSNFNQECLIQFPKKALFSLLIGKFKTIFLDFHLIYYSEFQITFVLVSLFHITNGLKEKLQEKLEGILN